jgi:hypothetical protein
MVLAVFLIALAGGAILSFGLEPGTATLLVALCGVVLGCYALMRLGARDNVAIAIGVALFALVLTILVIAVIKYGSANHLDID